jgi:hypothetical protein
MTSKYKKTDEMDLLSYKIDVLERRLDTIEKMIMNLQGNSKGSDLNAELLHLLMDMIKQPMQNNTCSHPPQAYQESTVKRNNNSSKSEEEKGDLFGFQRKRTVI